MGSVWEVEDARTGARYALKELTGSFLDPELRLRFKREAELLASLDHPHLVRVHSGDFAGESPYFVQELVSGGSLGARLREGPLELSAAWRIARELASALACAHQAQVVHRDLKPDNVLLDATGRVKVADWGLARWTADGEERLTQTGSILGTPAYMAPEQALDAKQAGAPADVYAFGALLYALLAGQPPFVAGSEGTLSFLARIQTEPAPSLRRDRADAPDVLVRLCAQCLAKSPSDRPRAQDLVQILAEPSAGSASWRTWSWVAVPGVALACAAALAWGVGARKPALASPPSGSVETRSASVKSSRPPGAVTPKQSPGDTWPSSRLRPLQRPTGTAVLVRFRSPRALWALDGSLRLSSWEAPTWEPRFAEPEQARPPAALWPRVLIEVEGGWVRGGVGPEFVEQADGALRGPESPARVGEGAPVWEGNPVSGVLIRRPGSAQPRLLIGSSRGQIWIDPHLATAPEVHALGSHALLALGWSASQERLVALTRDSASDSGSRVLARFDAQGQVLELERERLSGSGSALAIHPSGEWCVIGTTVSFLGSFQFGPQGLSPGELAVGRAANPLATRAHRGAVRGCAFSADGKFLVSIASGGGGENDLKLWEVAEPSRLVEVAWVELPAQEFPISLAVSDEGLVAVGTRVGSIYLIGPLERWAEVTRARGAPDRGEVRAR